MAAETRHAGLTADERSTIRSTVLKARETIENDLYRQLERYGVYDDERVDIDALGHLDAYDKQTRSQIDAALDRELEATDDDYERSVKNYVREATKTYLNRLVALKAIEARGLVTETMIKRPEYGNRSEMYRTVDEVAGELTDQSDNGLGVAVELAFTELTDEIGVIFEESEHTAIDLDFTVREDIIEQLNAIDVSVWESDEAMGWVYQYFGENEREEIDDRIDEKNYKIQDTDVATKTQLFTPRYIVEWMVDNSLGRLWLEMYGDETDIDDEKNCFYLAPLEESLIDRDVKDVRDIKVLDPACGSGHMLFYAFDVLYQMYLEQGDVAEKYIPREILRNNLYGIDIDPGAAQLAALSLYLKAKSKEPGVEIDQINIVVADAVLVNGEKKREVIEQTNSELERRILEQVWQSFEHIREWGSLVRIEEQIEEIIEEELEEIQGAGQTQFTDEGLAKESSVVSFSGEEESWEQVKERLLKKVSKLAERALEQDNTIEEMFAGEIEKSVRIVDVLVKESDVVLSNPPYLGSRKMEDEMKSYVKDNYVGSLDLYTAFIQRCSELVRDDGYVSMVTMENFMYLYSYRKLRRYLLEEMQVEELVHISNRDEEYMNVCFVMRKSQEGVNPKARFNRLVGQDQKLTQLRQNTGTYRANSTHEHTYIIDQNSFKQIEQSPFVYWLGDNILKLFRENRMLEELSEIKTGLITGDDDRFLRKWWELTENAREENYRRFQKSGTNAPYYDVPEDYVEWTNEGEQIKSHSSSVVKNEKYYNKKGLTFRGFGDPFVARKHYKEMIHSDHAHLIYSESLSNNYLLGLLNSSLTRFIMGGIKPGLNFTAGDGKKIPIKEDLKHEAEISDLVDSAIQKQKRKYSLTENNADFNPERFRSIAKGSPKHILYMIDLFDAHILHTHGVIDNLVFDDHQIPDHTIERIYNDTKQNLSELPHLENAGELEEIEASNVTRELISDEKYNSIIKSIREDPSSDIRSISESVKVSPFTVALIRHKHDFYTNDECKDAAGRLLSYYLGCAVGRWNLRDLDSKSDGIIVFDSDFDDNVMDYMRRCIELTYGEEELYDRESEIEDLLNKDIEDWLSNTFFRYYHCKEYRRRGQRNPIYWHVESDDGTFSCFMYYHSMDANSFPKLRGQYIDKKLDALQNRLEAIESELATAEGDHARKLRSEKEELQAEVKDISEFRDRVDALIDEGFEPDFEAGIWENIQKVDEHDLLAVPLDKL